MVGIYDSSYVQDAGNTRLGHMVGIPMAEDGGRAGEEEVHGCKGKCCLTIIEVPLPKFCFFF